jgi:CheY-like chemotaxis protein
MAKKGSVLICDDEEIMRDVLETIVSAAGYKVDLAKTGEEAVEAYAQRPYDVVLMDVSMPGMGGLTALQEIIKMDANAYVLMITAYATFDTAISAWEKGAEGCIRKPFQNEQILALVARGIKAQRKEEERVVLRQAMVRSVKREGFIGRSDIMENVFRLVERVAPARSTVLITGESGTGKELVAKAIHEASPRAEQPFVPVNCSNIPSELLESELFGHNRGAFTGAVAAKKGLFEVADGNAGSPAARYPGTRIYALGRNFARQGRRANHRRDERRFEGSRAQRHVSRRFVLPPVGRAARTAALERPQGRCSAAGAVFYPQIQRGKFTRDFGKSFARSFIIARKLLLSGQCPRA